MENNVLKVTLWGMTVGRLYWNKERGRAYFTYDQDFLTKGLDIAPLTASINSPLSQRGMPHAGNTDKLYAGLPEFIADYHQVQRRQKNPFHADGNGLLSDGYCRRHQHDAVTAY